MSKKRYDSNQTGFTIVELMIVVVVVSILAMIAIPAYNDSMMKGRRTDAKSALTTVAAQQEQYFMDNKTYTTDMKALGYTANPATSPDDFYVVSAAACASGTIATCFELTAIPPVGGVQEGDDGCTSMTLDSSGLQKPASCW